MALLRLHHQLDSADAVVVQGTNGFGLQRRNTIKINSNSEIGGFSAQNVISSKYAEKRETKDDFEIWYGEKKKFKAESIVIMKVTFEGELE